ncbi:MAG: dicarboxylate/amino acid:cation symporter [Flavobacteriales bacterium]|nr:dicarboxylate/amino acid:cation symporter [Flavobacteriales bacterium]MCX7767408.1 dicarboxylate/amino acid:cation symporter [Flavobacteriales bacterium]MDW8410176.1 dicarboxylate/amino acid:cation symporter [Flavobacteriales bacterium]
MKRIPLHGQILASMVLGVAVGWAAALVGGSWWIMAYVMPWGQIFLNLLKVIALPLVVASLVAGVASLPSLGQVTRIGGKTIALYLLTTVMAVAVGLVVAASLKPGLFLSPEKRTLLHEKFAALGSQKAAAAAQQKEKGPLSFLVDMVPDNLVAAASDNTRMLQIIVVALLVGVALVTLPDQKARPVREFFTSLNETILRLTEIIMKGAPLGVFGLMAGLIVQMAGDDPSDMAHLLQALGMYILCVLLALAIIIGVNYPVLLRLLAPSFLNIRFFRALLPAQQLAFTTSSSAATLPVTLDIAEKKLGIPEHISGFVLPLGATINMDGTSCYQAVATVFIAQVFGLELSLPQYLTIVLTATLASIGSAAVPGAGMVMLVVVLGSVGLGAEGLALIVAPDRLLDMARTVVNVTGDTVVASVVARSEGVQPTFLKNADNYDSF